MTRRGDGGGMRATLVIDCSIVMSWCFEDEASEAAQAVQDRLLEEAAAVPAHWPLEVVNALAAAQRRGRIPEEKAAQFLALLGALDILVDDQTASRAFDHLPPLCQTYGLTGYDAAYLELAKRRQLPLATLDDDLRRAAAELGVAVIGT